MRGAWDRGNEEDTFWDINHGNVYKYKKNPESPPGKELDLQQWDTLVFEGEYTENKHWWLVVLRQKWTHIGVRDGGGSGVSCPPPPNSGSLSTSIRAESRHYSSKTQYMFD